MKTCFVCCFRLTTSCCSINMASVDHVVVDAGGFIRNAPIRDIGKDVYSVSEVVNEITDKATKQRLQVLPYTLNLKRPSSEAVIFVSDFAKKTGDYKHLSKTDLCVLALTYMLEKQHVGNEHIRTEPLKKPAEYIIPKKQTASQHMAGFYMDTKSTTEDQEKATSDSQESNSVPSGTADSTSSPQDHSVNTSADSPSQDTPDLTATDSLPEGLIEEEEMEEEEEEEVMDDDDDDGDGWITPSNIGNVKSQMGIGPAVTQKTRVTVACLTTDFAMQNVLIQMGLNVVSVEGLLIKQARTYVNRCFACTKVTYDTNKSFCPNCGNKTMKRVAVTRDEEGKMRYFFSSRPLNIRGTKYALPKPQGGKHSNNPRLTEDQPAPQQRPRKSKAMDIFDPDYIAGSSPFAVHDVTSRAATIGISGKHDYRNSAYWQKRNPNEGQKRHGRRK